VFDEYILYFDFIDEPERIKNREKFVREETALFMPDESFMPSKAISALEKMRGTLIFRI